MSCPNPIHYLEVNVSAPHEDLDHGYIVVWFHRANGAHDYTGNDVFNPGHMARRWVRGMAALIAFTARTFPELMKVRGDHG